MAIGPKQALVLSLIVVLAVIGAIVGIVFSVQSSGSIASSSSGKSNGKNNNGTSPHATGGKKGDAGDSLAKETEIPETDPTTEIYSVSALAIGDWGRTVVKDGGSCCQRRKSFTVQDYNAMEYTASLLGLAAASMDPKPSVVIGHGDNFYWTGLQSTNDQAYRFEETFETKYADPALKGIPWVNVMGNHDYGGASFVCSQGDVPAMCESTEQLLSHLEQKFVLQSQYVSPNENRWQMPDRFFVHAIRDNSGTVDVEIYNTDTNDADSHGASQICCQCYGYSNGANALCENVMRGDQYCAGGDTQMYDACMAQLKTWAMDSRDKLVEAAKASNATWKIVNTHYSPYGHFRPDQANAWHDLLDGLDINIFMYGHTHGEKHDYSKPLKTHFIENGAGGGIQNESPSGIPPYAEKYIENVWAAGHYPYGIFSVKLSPNWAQVQFLTFDDTWVMQKDVTASVIGGIAVKHCWYIPRHGGKGRSCDKGDTKEA